MQSVLDSLSAIIDFFSMTFRSLVQLIELLPDLFVGIIDTFAWAPDFVLPFLTISVSVTMLFAVLKLL